MEVILEPGKSERHYWRDLWRYRELFSVLAWRDLSVRYKQTIIGVAWALIRPFLTMVIFTVVFGKVAQLPSEGGAPYALMVFAGMFPGAWPTLVWFAWRKEPETQKSSLQTFALIVKTNGKSFP